MNLQTIYFTVGVVGLVLAFAFAVAAVVYFLRADIRAVRRDLSGKTRQAGMVEAVEVKKRGTKKVLTQDKEWQGRVSHGKLSVESDTGAGTTGGLSDTGTGTGGSGSFGTEKPTETVDPRTTILNPPSGGVVFKVTRSQVLCHGGSVIDERGREIFFNGKPEAR